MVASSEQAESALARMQTMLAADGYQLDVEVSEGQLNLTVRATPEACAECLVPKTLLASMAVTMLGEGGIPVDPNDVALRYPADV